MGLNQELVRELLSDIVKTKPDLSVKDYKWLIGILKDQYNPKRDYQHVDCIKEINGLALCLLWGVVDSIKNNSKQNLETTEASALLKQLVKDYSQQEDLARWCLESWCIVLGKNIDLSVVDRLTAPLENQLQFPLADTQIYKSEQLFVNQVQEAQQNNHLDAEILINLTLEGKRIGLSDSKIKKILEPLKTQISSTNQKSNFDSFRTIDKRIEKQSKPINIRLIVLTLIVLVIVFTVIIAYKSNNKPKSYTISNSKFSNLQNTIKIYQYPYIPHRINSYKGQNNPAFGSGDWSMFGHDYLHSNRASYVGPKTLDISKYTSNMSNNSSATFTAGTNFYYGSGNKLYCNAIGTGGNWQYYTDGEIHTTPAIGMDGKVYSGCDDNNIYAVYPVDNLFWKFRANDRIRSSPVIDPNGNIFFGCNDTYFYSINKAGRLNWKFKTNGSIQSSPALGADGSVYFGSDDNNIYCLELDGTQKWSFSTSDIVRSSPSIGLDGTINIGSFDNFLYSIRPNGILKWKFRTKSSIEATPAIGADGSIYIGSHDGFLYSLSPNGKKQWEFKTGDKIVHSVAIGAEGTIHFGSNDGYIYALNPNGTEKWSYKTLGVLSASPSINWHGQVQFFTNPGGLYCTNQGNFEFDLSPVQIKATDRDYSNKVLIYITLIKSEPNPDGYYIYRALKKINIYQYIGKTFNLQYEDTNVEANKQYLYKVKAFKFASDYDDSEFSNIVEGTTD